MPEQNPLNRVAVCSWSLRPDSPEKLIHELIEIGIPRIQCALNPFRDNPDVWGGAKTLFQEANVSLISGMIETVGEDYTTLESIRQTGGVVPDATWDMNWENFKKAVEIAQSLELGLVTFHAGFLPHDSQDPDYAKLLDRLRRIAELFGQANIDLGFETGQESAEALDAFLKDLNQPNVGVNFDPANMILYDKGDPIEALKALRPWLKQCHIKDATRTKITGAWGEEVPVGEGEVDWRAFFDTLDEIGYQGAFAIEREAGDQRAADIKKAWGLVRSVIGNQ